MSNNAYTGTINRGDYIMAQRTFTGNGDVKALAKTLVEDIQKAGISNELVASATRQAGNSTIILLVFERYYYRSQNRASLTVMLVGDENGTITVDAVGAGGSQGVFLNFSWGAEEDFLNILHNTLIKRGFY